MVNNEDNIRYDTIALEEFTDKELNDWRSLPESIRTDICFKAYQKEHLKVNGK